MREPTANLVRRVLPESVRYHRWLRASMLGLGVIEPRKLHTPAEADMLTRLVQGRRSAAEIGVYEGASARLLYAALPPEATLYLVDPFVPNQLVTWQAAAWSTKRVLGRASRPDGPSLRWLVMTSEEAARGWSEPLDFVFIDGDHSEAGCRLDWEVWSPHVVPGGVVVFHDARAGHPGGRGHPGPTAVVESHFRGPDARTDWEIIDERDSAVAVERTASEPA